MSYERRGDACTPSAIASEPSKYWTRARRPPGVSTRSTRWADQQVGPPKGEGEAGEKRGVEGHHLRELRRVQRGDASLQYSTDIPYCIRYSSDSVILGFSDSVIL